MNERDRNIRFTAIKEIGCIVALSRGLGFVPCEIHHLTVGGKHGAPRRGDEFTVGLSTWSHRGIHPYHMTPGQARTLYGPSYAREPQAFRALWSDDALLAEQNRLIDIWRKSIVRGAA